MIAKYKLNMIAFLKKNHRWEISFITLYIFFFFILGLHSVFLFWEDEWVMIYLFIYCG